MLNSIVPYRTSVTSLQQEAVIDTYSLSYLLAIYIKTFIVIASLFYFFFFFFDDGPHKLPFRNASVMFTSGVYQLELLVHMAVDMKVCEADFF